MNISDSTRDLTKTIDRQTAELKAAVKALVKSLPPSPDVRRISRNCCVVSSSTMLAHDNWSPSYWINAEMETRICELIDRARPENLRRTIVQILRRGSYEISLGKKMRIHPHVLKSMRRAWLWGN